MDEDPFFISGYGAACNGHINAYQFLVRYGDAHEAEWDCADIMAMVPRVQYRWAVRTIQGGRERYDLNGVTIATPNATRLTFIATRDLEII